MIKKVIPYEIQKLFMAGTVVFLLLLFWGGRLIYQRSVRELARYKKQFKRVQTENKVAHQLEDLKKVREEMKLIKESSRFLAEIAKMAGQLNLKLKSISASPVERHDEFVKLGVQLEIDTTFHELGLFVSKLETAETAILVSDLSVDSDATRQQARSPRVDARMRVDTIYLTDTILEK